jgi:imidazole glycerol-phosphate synthase subunit HisH
VDTVYRVVEQGTPLLGICVGMQILFSESIEFGRVTGLDILKGKIIRFAPTAIDGGKIPHMGWNQLHIKRRSPHLDGIPDGAAVYFVHSYYPVVDDPEIAATTTNYGGTEFVSSVWWRNIFATQFHPEKSQAVGLHILANFGKLVAAQHLTLA